MALFCRKSGSPTISKELFLSSDVRYNTFLGFSIVLVGYKKMRWTLDNMLQGGFIRAPPGGVIRRSKRLAALPKKYLEEEAMANKIYNPKDEKKHWKRLAAVLKDAAHQVPGSPMIKLRDYPVTGDLRKYLKTNKSRRHFLDRQLPGVPSAVRASIADNQLSLSNAAFQMGKRGRSEISADIPTLRPEILAERPQKRRRTYHEEMLQKKNLKKCVFPHNISRKLTLFRCIFMKI